MYNFMHYEFPPNITPSSGYCKQKPEEPKIFECLYNYAGTIPSDSFIITYTYSKDGYSGFAEATIDPKKSSFAARKSY